MRGLGKSRLESARMNRVALAGTRYQVCAKHIDSS